MTATTDAFRDDIPWAEATTQAIGIAEQLECVERELRYRKRVYAYRVREGKMSQELAERELARMHAVQMTLMRLLQTEPFTLA